jgi:hypothetical protein
MKLSELDARWRNLGPTHDSHLPAALFATGAVTLGYALQLSNGTLHPVAFPLTATVLALCLLGVGLGRLSPRLVDAPAALVMALGLGVFLTIHLTTPPGVYLRVSGEAYRDHHAFIAAGALLIGAAFADPPFLRWFHVPAMLGVFIALGLWLLKASPSPAIDVWVWHNEAYAALKAGLNPYALTMPNIYGRTDWFAPGLADATHVFVGYPYPPMTLLLGGLGHAVAGDYRYANLFAMALTGGFIAYARPGRLSTIAAAAFLFTPRGLFVLEQGWTESLSVMVLAATVFCACRAPRLLPYAFGVMLGTKQYFVFALPLVPLLLERADWRSLWRFLLPAGAVAALVTLPFFLWNPGAFLDSVVTFQAKQPFRPDSLSVLARTAKDGAATLPLSLSFVAILPVIALGLWRAPRTPHGFAATFSAAILAFFFFAKQAFTNYYFLVIGGLCCAVAAVMTTPPMTTGSTEVTTVPPTDSTAVEPEGSASKVDTAAPPAPC